MQRYKNTIAKNICAFLLALLLSTFCPAQAEDSLSENFPCVDSSSVMDCVEKTQSSTPSNIEEMPLDTQQLGYQGPFNVAARYDTQLKWIPELSYVQLFYDNGINLLVDYGANERRANITLGHVWDGHQQAKITYEYLTQRLPYDFDSGTVKEWVNQNAIGAAYQYLFFNHWIHSVDLNAYYIQANNKDDLSDVIFNRDDETLINFRRIAGGKEGTGTANISIHPFRQALISLGGGYSQIDYDIKYEDHSNNTTFAYNAGIEYLFNSRIKISSNLTHDAAQTEEKVRLSTIVLPKIEAALSGDFSQGLNSLSNSTSVLFSLAYPVSGYTLFSEDSLASLKAWVQQPVVHAPRVLAIKDEETKQIIITSSSSPSPQFLQTGDIIQEVHTNDYFKIDPTLFDKVLYTISLKDNSNNYTGTPTPQSALNIDVKNDNNSVYQSIIYSTSPIPNSAAPENSRNSYEVVITAYGYKNNQIITSDSVILELNINFNPNNEPQWDKNKANQKIPFDVGSITDPQAILLNSLLISSPSNITPKFTFTGNTTISGDWQIVTSGNQSYLVRNPDSTGAYNAGDITIGSATKNLTVYTKYSSDPDNYQGSPLTLILTVNPDPSLQLGWDGNNSSCKVPTLDAHQPLDSKIVNTIAGAACIQYKKSNNTLKVSNDVLTFKNVDKGGFSGNVNLTGNQLQLGYPDSGLGKNYNFNFIVDSAAQGSDSTITVNNFVSVSKTMVIKTEGTGTGQNFYQFKSGMYLSSVIINNLDAGEYSVDSSSPSIPNGYCTQGLATSPQSFESCNAEPYSNSFSLINNQADLIWTSGYSSPDVSTVTITKK